MPATGRSGPTVDERWNTVKNERVHLYPTGSAQAEKRLLFETVGPQSNRIATRYRSAVPSPTDNDTVVVDAGSYPHLPASAATFIFFRDRECCSPRPSMRTRLEVTGPAVGRSGKHQPGCGSAIRWWRSRVHGSLAYGHKRKMPRSGSSGSRVRAWSSPISDISRP